MKEFCVLEMSFEFRENVEIPKNRHGRWSWWERVLSFSNTGHFK
jgi:hypothetical protein